MDLKATVTTVIHSTVDRVWKALLDPDEGTQYMMGPQMTTDWQEGSPIEWKVQWHGKDQVDHGKVMIVRDAELLKYSRSGGGANGAIEEHIVTIELRETAGVTHIRLTQDNNTDQGSCDRVEKNWTVKLDGLKKMLGEAPMPSPEEPRV